MALAARETDAVATGHGCDTTTKLDVPGQGTVFAEGLLWARLDDKTKSHDEPSGEDCVAHIASISGSSSSVYVEGVLCARKGDGCDAGSITGSAATVYAG